MDNLNTHTPASLYEAFPPAEAKRLADKLEIHYTPKHGSWLNIAEIELSVLAAPVPGSAARRPGYDGREVAAWEHPATRRAAIDWHFTTADARIKLKRLYPVIHPCRTTRAARSEVRHLAPRRVDIRPKVGPARETPSAGRTLLQMNGRLHPLASMELGELLPVNADIDRDLPAGSVRVEAVERPIGRE